MALTSHRQHKIYIAATMGYGLGSDDPEEIAYYNKMKAEIDTIDTLHFQVKAGIISTIKLFSFLLNLLKIIF